MPQKDDYSEQAAKVRALLGKRPGPHYAYVRTYGCQQNFADGEKLAGILSDMGYELIDSPDDAEFVIFNTCAVRENAERRVFGNVGLLKKAKAENPDMMIAVCGCMVQQEHIAEKFHRSYPFVDLVFGTHAVPRLPSIVLEHMERGRRVCDIGEGEGCMDEELPTMRAGGLKAYLPVMHGCDNFCTYCVVPLVRGREESREPEAVLAEAREIVAAGYKEIMLLGQNVNSYGKGLSHPTDFAELLHAVNDIDGDFRIRFMTSHPKDCSRELLDAVADCGKVCRHIHLPVQSGSDRILSEMNRHYTARQYLDLLAMARELIPGVTVTSDIIIGFPGETREDFDDTLRLAEEARWLMTYTFIYSKRVGTRAASMPDPVTDGEKHERFDEFMALQTGISREMNASFVGRTVRVLFDDEAEAGDGYISGRSAENIVVRAPRQDVTDGLMDVRLRSSLGWALDGEIIKNKNI